jgi:ABC-type antimicrobial peptide transport system ATPase subunit
VTVQAGILRLLDALRRDRDLLGHLDHTRPGGDVVDRRPGLDLLCGRVVESGPRADVLPQPRHPYTRALLDALPHPEAARIHRSSRSRAHRRTRSRSRRVSVPPAVSGTRSTSVRRTTRPSYR